ncbi:MAG: UvrD-helicase domain-containing protein [Desulfobacterales bacterium]
MKFIADLHVHSKYSRATAKNLDLENLYIAAQLKGVTVVGTGDFTYPAWFEEISDKLVAAEPGLYKLKAELARICDLQVPEACRGPVRFMLVTEISNIYKKNEQTRKNHNLVFAPDVDVARRFKNRLDKVGNIQSDGRPILGLDARDLLEMLLETSDDAFLIPAHIWTPWFSVLGSKSGFDSVAECFEDLTPHIFAVETGLSSDPAMNWRVSSLDEFTLVSNSDAHSPLNLGREANLFNTELSYAAIKSALNSGDPEKFLGTLEFYPEEGKYHIDGHRACNVSLWPAATLKHNGLCPVCSKPLTLGVLHRVEELADHKEGRKPSRHAPYHSIIQLADILSEVMRVGPRSKKVTRAYHSALDKLGSEFNILHNLETDAIEQAGIPLLAEAVRRMRQQEIKVIPGFDGQYGRIQIFQDQERTALLGQKSLFTLSGPWAPAADTVDTPFFHKAPPKLAGDSRKANSKRSSSQIHIDQMNDEQRRAVEHPEGPLLIIAGPGTGKTLTLTMRIAHFIMHKGIAPEHILAMTFTRKAAEEMQQRLRKILGERHPLPPTATFHSLCYKILSDLNPEEAFGIIDEDNRKKLIEEAVKRVRGLGIEVSLKPQQLRDQIIAAKQKILGPEDIAPAELLGVDERALAEVYHSYQSLLFIQGLYDYEDLIFNVVRLLENDQKIRTTYRRRFEHLFVDEYQDLNHGQYRIIRALMPSDDAGQNLCAIGDPDQSIYGFRGSDVRYFTRFVDDYPNTAVIELTRNYRSTETILDASYQIIQDHRLYCGDARTYSMIDGAKTINILELASGKAEARAIAGTISQLVGGSGFHSVDTGQVPDANLASARSYADFAVLVRTHHQLDIIAEVLSQEGVPFQIASRKNGLDRWGLAELISLLRLIEGYGSDPDLNNCLSLYAIGLNKKATDQFKSWCYTKKFSQQKGLDNARRFPVPGLHRAQQQKLIDFGETLAGIKNETAGMRIAEKLQHLSQIPQLTAIMGTARQSRDAFGDLLALAEDYDKDTAAFLATASLHTDTDVYVSRAEKVALMTIHAAKGLEFPVVFIAGCEDDLIPLAHPGNKKTDPGEERRLFYVAMTRAMQQLYLTRAKKRSIYGKLLTRRPSPFLADIESRIKKDETPPKKSPKNKEKKQQQLKLF